MHILRPLRLWGLHAIQAPRTSTIPAIPAISFPSHFYAERWWRWGYTCTHMYSSTRNCSWRWGCASWRCTRGKFYVLTKIDLFTVLRGTVRGDGDTRPGDPLAEKSEAAHADFWRVSWRAQPGALYVGCQCARHGLPRCHAGCSGEMGSVYAYRTHSIQNTFYTQHILYRTHSMQNTYYFLSLKCGLPRCHACCSGSYACCVNHPKPYTLNPKPYTLNPKP